MNHLFSAVCPLLLLIPSDLAPAAESFRLDPEAESSVRRTLTTRTQLDLVDAEVMMNGEEQPRPDGFELSIGYEEELIVVDAYGNPTRDV